MRTSTARSGLPATSCPLRIASQPIRPRCTALARPFLNNSESCRGSCATCCAAATSPSAATQGTPSEDSGFQRFKELCSQHTIVPLLRRVYSDQLTPVLAYRCLVKEDDREMPSFLLESVVNGDQSGRYSFIGSHPSLEVVARGNEVTVLDHHTGQRTVTHEADPMDVPVRLSRQWKPARIEGLPDVFTGGWVGFAGYDTIRYVYPGKLPLSEAPEDDRQLPDMHLALYNNVVVFDQATKLAYVVSWVHPDEYPSIEAAYVAGKQHLNSVAAQLTPQTAPSLANARVDIDLTKRPQPPAQSNMTKQEFLDAVDATKEYIQAGDVFQLVLSQRFERRTYADPFEIYRSLRIVNPSPYMVYLQVRGAILVASSPEILCNVDGGSIVTNRPLAGTRQRGATPERDLELEQDLLADEKECAEHVMLVDLGRNDVGKVSKGGSVKVDRLMDIERYSHVMHISSTVTGELLPELDCWDALRAALPAGTVSGAPKVRAMQIIDELESTRRGPYGGGIGHVSFTGEMDMALALRTMVIPLGRNDTMYQYGNAHPRREWVVHLQAGAGLVADSVPEKEYEETVNKAAALSRAIDLAEKAFVDPPVGL